MEVIACSAVAYGEKSHHPQENSVTEFMGYADTDCAENAKLVSPEDTKVNCLLTNDTNVKEAMKPGHCDVQGTDGEPFMVEQICDANPSCVLGENGQKSVDVCDHEDNFEQQNQLEQACLDFQNSHVDVNTIDSELLCDNREEELSISASKWPEHDEALALWVKWRGKWQAGIKCERADWPLATVKAKPTHDRKSYIVIFFPHTRNYSWADTLLVCAIDELPQPIAHQSHKAGVQLVEDLTVARRFIMKKLVIGVLNIVDQLHIQVLAETARDIVVWKDFAAEASRCKGYPDVGRLLLKLQNMLLPLYIDSNWLQHSFHLWADKCQNALSADSIELLKEELVEAVLWSEVDSLRDGEGQPALGSEWKLWKHEVIKCFSTTAALLVGGYTQQPGNDTIERLSPDVSLITSPQVSRKRPKLEVRRAEANNSQLDNKSPQKITPVEIDSAFFTGMHDATSNNVVVPFREELTSQGTPEVSSPGNRIDRWDKVVTGTLNAESVPEKDNHLQGVVVNGAVETDLAVSKTRSRQCIAFVEAKGRRCVRWANDGDDYCCVHLSSRIPADTVKVDSTPPADAPMCQGTTTLGHRCKHRSLPGSSFCKKHRPHGDGMKSPTSHGTHLKRKHGELSGKSELNSCKDIVIAQQPPEECSLNMAEENIVGANYSLQMSEHFAGLFNSNNIETACCVGLGLGANGGVCRDSPKRHSLYCEDHIPIWLKRARNGKSRIISKDIFLDLLKACSSQKQKIQLHQACEIFYKLFKSIFSVRNQVPKEIQLQWTLSEASKDPNVADLLMKLVSREKERLRRIWGVELNKTEHLSSSHVEEKALVPVEEGTDNNEILKCKICSEEFDDDQTLGAHWIDSHNKEAQWLFRGYACAICLDSFTNRKVLETHVQERHHAQFVEHCMLIQCIPCGSHFGNSEELWSHVLSAHTERFRQSETADDFCPSAASQQRSFSIKPDSNGNNSGTHSSVRRFICRFCGLKFDLLPDLGRHHQAAHMGASSLCSRPKKKGLRFYTYRLKSGRLSRPRLKKGLGGASYRLRNPGGIILKKRLQPASSVGDGINMKCNVMGAASLARLTEAHCSAIAKLLCSEAHKTKARPNNHEILSMARSTCCKVSLQRSLEQKYGALPERLYLKAAKLCSEHNIQVSWHQEGFNCSRGCKPLEDQSLAAVLTCPQNECGKMYSSSPISQLEECEMDECHYVIDSHHFKQKQLQTTIILCDDISFGQEEVPVPCVVEKYLIDSLHIPTYAINGKVVFLPWEGFTYVTKPVFDPSRDADTQNLQLGCGCSQSACSSEACDHVYLFNSDYDNAKDIDGKLMEGRFTYDDRGRLMLEDNYLVYECNHMCKCDRNCPNRVLQNGVRVKLEVFKTVKKGWAVRASEIIPRGTFVCEFVGEVLEEQEASKRRNRYGKDTCDYIYDTGVHVKNMSVLIEGQAGYLIDASRYGNVSRFINHSCSPNLASHLVLVESMDLQLAHVGLYAKQDIDAGEELCFDYRCELQPGEGCSCLCGATNCRGRFR